MEFTPLADNVFHIKDALRFADFTRVYDEFSGLYSPVLFTKVENTGGDTGASLDIHFGAVFKPGDSAIGDNPTFFAVASRVALQAQKVIRKPLILTRINTNIQYFGQEATFHTDADANHWTCVLFISPNWHFGWGGELLINAGGSDVLSVPYVPNNGALFRSDILPRGSAPNRLCAQPRNSLALTFTTRS